MSALQAESRSPSLFGKTASVSLDAAHGSVEAALRVVSRDASSLGRWRCLSELLDARRAFVNHSSVCTSQNGPIVHLVSSKPRLTAHMHRLDEDHNDIRIALDRLIAYASRREASAIDATLIAAVARRIQKHRLNSTGLAFEWANRDIGGEG